ncbi:DUF2243 domain-containing protein [Aquipuribacter sp. MA13-6]|uniref:DUF2243 domain-containing protein n=1 Tax=unclassified Aquipuribacter TaxID=2635084 RepID=UPI003EE95393
MDPAGGTERHRVDEPMTVEGAPPGRRASTLAAGVVGVGLMAAVDEIVFHQLLRWHSFYDRSTPDVAIMSDGLLHAAELVALVAGVVWLLDLQRDGRLHRPSAAAGLLLGAGAFQLFDGVVNHKLLRLHQVRYDVDLLPYDLAWNGAAVVLLGLGGLLAWRARGGR